MRFISAAVVVLTLAGCGGGAHLGRDEQVVFFPTVGYPADEGGGWVMPVHGWVYEQSWWSRNLPTIQSELGLESVLESPADRARLSERLAPFVASNQEGRSVRIILGGETLALGPALENGHFHERIYVPSSKLGGIAMSASAAGPVVMYRALCSDGDSRECVGFVHLVGPEGLTIVSDIDDTIRHTEVLNTKEMLKNTFVRPMRAVPGMAELYRDWVRRCGGHVHYLSASPAQLAGAVKEFLSASGFPDGTLALRTVDWRSNVLESVLELFDAPPAFKIAELVWLMDVLPGRRYVLIGDSAQSDPEVYGAIARSYRDQVLLVLIRDVTCCEGRDSPRYQAAFHDVPDSSWVLFRQPDDIRPFIDAASLRQGREQKRGGPPWQEVFVRRVAAYK